MKLDIGHFFAECILVLTLLMGLCFTNAAHSHAQNPANDATGSIQLTPTEKAWLDRHPVITIAGPRSFPPFHYYEEGKLKGLSADYITQIAANLGLKLRILADLPWPQVLESVQHGEIDLIACIAKTAERETFLDFSVPYLTFPLVIITRDNSPVMSGIEDLQGKTLAMVPKTLVPEWLSRDGIEFSPLYVQSPLHVLEAVAFSRADAAIENLAAANYLIYQNGLANLKIAAPTPYDKYRLYMAVPKGHQALLSIIDKALPTIAPRQKNDIRNHWLSVKYDYGVNPKDVFRYIFLILLFALGVIFIVLFRSHRLAKETRERKKAEKDREALQRQLIQARKLESIGTLAGGIAHDFNNILGIILGNAQLALLDLPEEHPSRARINDIQTACLRAKDVVLQLLNFSRQTKQEKQPLNPAQLVTDTVRLLRASLPSSIEILCQNNEPIKKINANPTQIQQVIINLCNNAAQAMAPDGGTLTIRLEMADTHNLKMPERKAFSAAEAVRLTIKDTGTGIDPAIQDRIFDPYFTTKELGKGSGMGLAIVHGIVHNHGGVISVKSKMGSGAVFSVLLPAIPDSPDS
ncbi:transporter substrate-binding domain-containing protein [Desulfobacter sp.]